MRDKIDPKKARSLTELEFMIFCQKFGEKTAIEIMRGVHALREESAIRRGLKEQKDS